MTAVSPAIVAVAALLAGGAVLAFGRSPWTAPATGPWAVAGGAIVVAGRADVYDSLVPPPSAAILLASVGALAAAVWVVREVSGPDPDGGGQRADGGQKYRGRRRRDERVVHAGPAGDDDGAARDCPRARRRGRPGGASEGEDGTAGQQRGDGGDRRRDRGHGRPSGRSVKNGCGRTPES